MHGTRTLYTASVNGRCHNSAYSVSYSLDNTVLTDSCHTLIIRNPCDIGVLCRDRQNRCCKSTGLIQLIEIYFFGSYLD